MDTARTRAAQELGRLGGKATAQGRTAEERSEAGRHAVGVRWAKDTTPPCPVCGRRHRLEARAAKCL